MENPENPTGHGIRGAVKHMLTVSPESKKEIPADTKAAMPEGGREVKY